MVGTRQGKEKETRKTNRERMEMGDKGRGKGQGEGKEGVKEKGMGPDGRHSRGEKRRKGQGARYKNWQTKPLPGADAYIYKKSA